MHCFRLDSGAIVIADQEERLDVPGGRIDVIPAWRWFLD